MARLAKFFKSRIFLTFLGVVFLSLVIWFLGPLLGLQGQTPLESSYNRVLAIGGLSLFWFLSTLYRYIKSRRKNAQMLKAVAAEQPVSDTDTASAEELEILQEKMQEAVDTLKNRNFSKKGDRRFIYELPWYAIIGPPGAGKTTLLSNSGLDFPLEDSHGKYSIKGVGGTRNCDWWFTDQAVLLDTAGRYTTQDSEAEIDKSAWTGFLNILKKHRSRRPLNGVLVAVSIQDIVQSDDDSLIQMAKTIRTRIDELYKLLEISPPVYLLFTKCDLLAGFNEFFTELGTEERSQVWGITLPLDTDIEAPELFDQELKILGRTINQQSVAKLQRELSQRNRDNIYGFPLQFAYAHKRIQSFTQYLTANSRLLENIFFRGLYFTSATQTGSVLDQVIHNVSRGFGMDQRVESMQPDSGKSFFINRLLNEVVFNESGLAGTNAKNEKRLKAMQIGAGSLVGLVLAGLLVTWIGSYQRNSNALERVDVSTNSLIESVQALPSDSLDLLATNKVLNDASDLKIGSNSLTDSIRAKEDGFLIKRLGLNQGSTINESAINKYDELLIDALLPRLMSRLEYQMHSEVNNSEFVFEALKTYQMIADRDHFDADAVIGWFYFDIDENLPKDTPVADRKSLKQHIARLFRERPYRLSRTIDLELVKQFQEIAAAVTTEQRAYNRIKNSAQGDLNSYYKLTDNAGPEVPLVFTRSDGISIDQSIPSLFTIDGYQKVFLPASKKISETLAEDSWVLGEYAGTTSSQISPKEMRNSVEQLYYADYINIWDTLISTLKLKSAAGLQQTSEFISLISDSNSPLKNLLVVIAVQTELTKLAADKDSEDANDGQESSTQSRLKKLLGNSESSAALLPVVKIDPVTEHFRSLRKLTLNWEKNESELDNTLVQLSELNLQLLPMAQSPTGSIDPQLSTELAVNLQQLELKADRLPEPMASLVKGLSDQISDVVGGGACQQLNAAWQADVYSFYQRAIQSRYPVNRKGTADIASADFGAFFGHDGIIDQFVNTYLAAKVSKTPGQWTWVGKGSTACLSDNTLKQLAFADDIKKTFFSQSGQKASFQFDLDPNNLNMSLEINELLLDVGGNKMKFFHGPVDGNTSFTWPGNNTQVSLRVSPVIPGTSANISMNGPWAILRLFEQGARKRKRSGLIVNYNFSGRPVSMTLNTSSFNPLDSVALRNFRCPESL